MTEAETLLFIYRAHFFDGGGSQIRSNTGWKYWVLTGKYPTR